MDQLNLSTLVAQSYVAGNELTEPKRIYVCNAGEVQKDLRLSFFDQASNRSVQRKRAAANSYAAPQVKHSYISLAAFMNIKIDHLSLLRDFEHCSQAFFSGRD